MQDTTRGTWRDYAHLLTPQQMAHMERSAANDNHPNGPEWHRCGLIVMARDVYGMCGAGGLN